MCLYGLSVSSQLPFAPQVVMSQLLLEDGRFGPRRVLLQLRPVWHIFLPYSLLSILLHCRICMHLSCKGLDGPYPGARVVFGWQCKSSSGVCQAFQSAG